MLNFLLPQCEKLKFATIEEFCELDLEDFDIIIAMGGDGTVSKIASRHPEMLNKILNKATKEVNDCFEILSKGGECEN